MVSQLLFGEIFSLVEKKNSWCRIKTHWDEYDGWVDQNQITFIISDDYKKIESSSVAVLLEESKITYNNNEAFSILPGSSLPFLKTDLFKIGPHQYTLKGLVSQGNVTPEKIPQLALGFIHAPYLWGGRCSYGIDCSGFTNIVFKMAGIRLRRDAWQQSEQGRLISFINDSRPGDLAFFSNEEGRITHTGIILEHHKIIHASGKVRIDTLDHFGIYDEEKRRYSHTLRLIKRILA